ncbi:MAG: T9SS type A sorting domain-containing protein, partial [Chitinophagaceae bacterium]
ICQAPNVTKYQWGFDKRASLDSTIITGATTQNFFVGSGSNFDPTNNYYWVMATFSDGCVRKAYYNAPNALAVSPVKTFAGVPVKVYPNPVEDVFTVEIPNTPITTLTIEIFDLTGRRLQTTNSSTAKTVISAEHLLPGYYVVVCSQNGERIATTRFIKK